MLITGAIAAAVLVLSAGAATPTPGPRYELHLSSDEYAVVHGAVSAGVKNYGGDADFRLTAARDINSGELVWKFTATNPRLIEVMKLWMSETTAELIGVVDFDKLDEGSKLGLRAVQSVNAKIRQSLANPVYDLLTLPGTLDQTDGRLVLRVDDGELAITGTRIDLTAAPVRELIGKPVVATGFVKKHGELEVARIIDRKVNTVELYVMSGCPFAKMAEQKVIETLRHEHLDGDLPNLEVHYVFTRKVDDAGNATFGSLHGEPEIVENLVQMVIRDTHPDRLLDYLEVRCTTDKPWRDVADTVGLSSGEIESIDARIRIDRHDLIEREYARMISRYGNIGASPTFVWESVPVTGIASIPPLKAIELHTTRCNGESS